MSFRRVRTTLITLTTCLISVSSLAAPERLVIVRHSEKLDTWRLCQTGLDRAQALSDQYLGPNATQPLFSTSPPAAILTLSIHTLETAQPTALSRNIPTTNYVALPSANTSPAAFEAQMNHQNRLAVHDLLNDARYKGKQVLMFWEHFHTASAALEARYPDEQVTLRQLLKLDQPPFDKQVPATWPDSSYNYFWIVDFNADGSIKAFNTERQRYQGRYANLPDNDWGAPEALSAESPCLRN
jgi:hypothetical protein